MAPTTRKTKQAATPPAAKNTDPKNILTAAKVRLAYLLITACLTAFCIGGAGLLVLSDVKEKHYSISHTEFASQWIFITEKQPLLTAVLFNGGMVGFLLNMKKIVDHKAASAALKLSKTK